MLEELESTELSGWLAYLRLNDELEVRNMVRAFSLVFGQKEVPKEDGEEVIDTTNPEFAKTFKGFIGEKK